MTVYFARPGDRFESDITTEGTAEYLDVLVADVRSKAIVVDINTTPVKRPLR